MNCMRLSKRGAYTPPEPRRTRHIVERIEHSVKAFRVAQQHCREDELSELYRERHDEGVGMHDLCCFPSGEQICKKEKKKRKMHSASALRGAVWWNYKLAKEHNILQQRATHAEFMRMQQQKERIIVNAHRTQIALAVHKST